MQAPGRHRVRETALPVQLTDISKYASGNTVFIFVTFRHVTSAATVTTTTAATTVTNSDFFCCSTDAEKN